MNRYSKKITFDMYKKRKLLKTKRHKGAISIPSTSPVFYPDHLELFLSINFSVFGYLALIVNKPFKRFSTTSDLVFFFFCLKKNRT